MPNIRNFLLLAIAFTGFMLWQAWQQDYANKPDATGPANPADLAQLPVGRGVDTPVAGEIPKAAADGVQAVKADDGVAGTSRKIQVATDVLRLEIDTRGGTVNQAALLQYPLKPKDFSNPVVLLNDAPATWFVAQSGLIANSGGAPDHHAEYQVEQDQYHLAPGQDALEVRLHWQDAQGHQVDKIYRLRRGSYVIDVAYEISSGAAPWQVSFYQQLQRVALAKSGGFSLTSLDQYSFVGAAWYSPEGNFEKLAFDKFSEDALKRSVQGGWLAMLQHYFFAAWIPDPKQKFEYATDVVDANGQSRYLLRAVSPLYEVPANGRLDLASRLYVGPKQQDVIGKIAPKLEYTVDYGKVTFIADPLFHWVLNPLHKLVGNWGWAIVLTTLLLKILLYPLSEAQYRSMAKMRKMQPRLQALKERHGDDRQKMNQAMMELYKKEKINPLGGCLPLLVQIPVFIALYWVLLESVELRHAPFIGWIQNLSEKDPYFVLPVLNGIAMFLGQKLTPTVGMDPMQARVMQMMPIVFSVMFAFFPAGLVLYWTVNGVLSLLQQWLILRRVENKAA